ncbi:MAG: S-layer homology domain-containing protein [Schwartzia sp.]|nr:S-layer homology domain-containing protein [Schwartzia sp. (in: firmicutes)]
MKMQRSAVCMMFLLAALLLPLKVIAAPQIVEEFFPSGEITKPQAPFLRYSGASNNGDSIQMWYNIPKDVLALSNAYNRWSNSDGGSDGFIARFGVEEYRLYLQTDASIDGGSWQYSDEWDDGEWPGLPAPHALAFHCMEGLNNNPNKIYPEMDVSWLTYIEDGNTGFLAPIVTPFTVDGGTNYHYDLKNHTLAVRCRLMLEYWTRGGEKQRIFSPWSPETSIGRNGTQEALTAPGSIEAPILSDFSIVVKNDRNFGRYYLEIPESVYDGVLYCESQEDTVDPYYIQVQMRVNGGEWQDVYIANPKWIFSGHRFTETEGGLKADDAVAVRARLQCKKLGIVSNWSNVVGVGTDTAEASFTASQWAQGELEEAAALGLIPDSLKEADLTEPITRAEYAVVRVKCYEALTDMKAEPYPSNPFTDTTDAEVLKAFNIGVTNGTGPTTFAPDVILNREQAATMLTRIYKKIEIGGWTLETDGNYSEEFRGMFETPEPFADDENISGWAKDSVYFMKAKGIIDGVGGNKFAPRAITDAEETAGYAQATREQAILIAKRMVKKLG